MAFENVFQGIDWQAPNRAAAQQQQMLMQAIGKGIGSYEAGQDRELKERQLEQKALKESQLDLQQSAEQSLYNKAMGLPYDESAIQAYSQLKGAQTFIDLQTQQMVTQPSLAQRAGMSPMQAALGVPQAGAPQAGGTPVSMAQLDAGFAPTGPRPPPPTPAGFPPVDAAYVPPPGFGARGAIKALDVSADIFKKQAEEKRAAVNLMKYNSGQLEAANFANRMVVSAEIMDSLSPEAQEAKTGFVGGIAKVLTALPLGDTGTGLGDAMVKIGATEEQQRYLNAANNWIGANLRKESGAVIGVEEMAKDYAKYFPMPLDKPGVLADKARLRKEAEKGMVGQSAGSYQLQFGKKAQSMKDRGELQGTLPQSQKFKRAQELRAKVGR